MASRMNSTRVRQPSSSVVTAAIFDWKPWQLRQLSNSVCLPRASGRSCRPCNMVRSLQRTGAVCSAKSCAALPSAASVMPLLGSDLVPSARTLRR